MASAFLNFHHHRLIELAARYRLPSIWESSGYVRDGGLLSYGPSFPDMYRRSAGYIAKILRGTKASDLPIEQPIKFEFSVNLKGGVAELVGIEGGVVSGVINLESSGVEASDWRPRHDEQYHEV
jgi:ABC-type uncharacterized transport system substrate-binding protein